MLRESGDNDRQAIAHYEGGAKIGRYRGNADIKKVSPKTLFCEYVLWLFGALSCLAP